MAKVFSWEIDKSKVYAYIVNPNNTAEAYVGEELFGSDLDKVISWTSSCSDEEYEGHFIQMSTLCIERGYQVKFESASAYMSVSGVCENLRGPAGRGIKNDFIRWFRV